MTNAWEHQMRMSGPSAEKSIERRQSVYMCARAIWKCVRMLGSKIDNNRVDFVRETGCGGLNGIEWDFRG